MPSTKVVVGVLVGAPLGVLAGLGVVVMLPVLGPVGAVSAAGAAVAAGVGGIGGAVTGAAVASKVGSDRKAAYDEGRQDGRAENVARLKALKNRVEREISHKQGFKQRLQVLLTVGFSAAGCDGPPSEAEREIITDFLLGASNMWLTDELQQEVGRLCAAPPSFGDAMLLLDELGDASMYDLVDDMIALVVLADGSETPDESAFRQAWADHRCRRQAEVG